jgi:hypothetical protein
MTRLLVLLGIAVFVLTSVVTVDLGQGDDDGLGLISSALAGRRNPPPRPAPRPAPPPPPPNCAPEVNKVRDWANGEIRNRDVHIDQLSQSDAGKTNGLNQCNAVSAQRQNRLTQLEAELNRANSAINGLQQGAAAAAKAMADKAAAEEAAKKTFYESLPVLADMMTKAYDAIKAQRAQALKIGTALWAAAKLIDEAGPDMQKKLMAAAKEYWNNLKLAFDFLTVVRRLQDSALTYDPADEGDVTRIASLRTRGITPDLLKGILANESGGALAQYGAVLQGVGAKQLSAAFEAAKEGLVASTRIAEGYFNAALRLLDAKHRKSLTDKGAQKFGGMITASKDKGLDGIVKLIVEIEEGLRGKSAKEEGDSGGGDAKQEGGGEEKAKDEGGGEQKQEEPPPEEK